MWVKRSPEEEESWERASSNDARSHGRFGAWIVFILLTLLISGGWIVGFRSGVLVQNADSSPFLHSLPIWQRVPLVALVVAPFCWWISRRETRLELSRIRSRTICPKCDRGSLGNHGSACPCGGTYSFAKKLKWVDAPEPELEPELASGDLFYDNATEPLSEGVRPTDAHRIQRVYCLRFSKFTSDDWTRLDHKYKSLPGWLGYVSDGQCPCWFGEDDSKAYWLWASVEPSGLLVSGNLRLEDWVEWDEAFQARLHEFPTFRV